MRLFLVRHGQSLVNLPDWDWDSDHSDQPLTPLGRKQAERAGHWLKANVPARHLYASTMKRANETAEIIGQIIGLPIQSDDRLREVGSNGPDGAPLAIEKLTRYVEGMWGSMQPYDPMTANGETWMQFRQRVGNFIESLQRSFSNHLPETDEDANQQTVLLVCHGGVIEAAFEYVFEKGPWSVVWVMSNNTGITYLEYKPVPLRPAWRLHYHNQREHLPPEMIS